MKQYDIVDSVEKLNIAISNVKKIENHSKNLTWKKHHFTRKINSQRNKKIVPAALIIHATIFLPLLFIFLSPYLYIQ